MSVWVGGFVVFRLLVNSCCLMLRMMMDGAFGHPGSFQWSCCDVSQSVFVVKKEVYAIWLVVSYMCIRLLHHYFQYIYILYIYMILEKWGQTRQRGRKSRTSEDRAEVEKLEIRFSTAVKQFQAQGKVSWVWVIYSDLSRGSRGAL